ncbi:chorismate synthase [Thermoplasmatales archaeon SW_10_69_26]|nr:MAG: chorismate synthase [Thermoplasmatales archaeon SW_10_69_26]
MNTLGNDFQVSILGESHGDVVGVLVDGVPSGIPFDHTDVQPALLRRRPGQSDVTTPRDEGDVCTIDSGTKDGVTTGAPVLMLIHNEDVDSSKYHEFLTKPRPGHADLTARILFADRNDYRGGGMFSGRLTAGLVMAGSLARKYLAQRGIEVAAHVRKVADVEAPKLDTVEQIRENVEDNLVRCADPDAAERMTEAIREARDDEDSLGGIVQCIAEGLPPGLGEPLFQKVEGVVGHAMMSLPATKGVQFGQGYDATEMRGSEHNDNWTYDEAGRIETAQNDGGGVFGGITSGMPIRTEVIFKPPTSIGQPQDTIDLETGEDTSLTVEGRHDPCILPRAVPVVEATMACAIMDLFAMRRGRGHGGA